MLLLQLPVELLCLLTMRQAPFAQFASVGLYASNLLKARMIITTYNQHVRLLSSEPFGWFAPPKSTRPWQPTLFMESLLSLRSGHRQDGWRNILVSLRPSDRDFEC